MKTMIAVLMTAVIATSSVAVFSSGSVNAAYSQDYGTVYNIDIAPGFSYTYTPAYPSDLSVTTTIEKYESAGIDASVSNNTLTVSVKNGITAGSFDLVLKASTATAGLTQTAYQHIRFSIVDTLSVSGSINNTVQGFSINFTPAGSSGMGAVIWTVKTGTSLPAGLSLSGGKITGIPTTVGTQTVSLTATAAGETKDLVISFIVYNIIVGGTAETIFSTGNTVSSAVISQITSGDATANLTVSWSVKTGTIPTGFSLDPSTGVISGSSTANQESVVVIEGKTSGVTPSQSTIKTITVRSEPAMTVSSDESTVITYTGNTTDKTLQMTTASGTSAIVWSVLPTLTGVSIDQSGVLKVTGAAAVTSGTAVTVTATSAYGQTSTKVITIIVEDITSISGASSFAALAGTPGTTAFTAGEDVTWGVDTTNVPVGTTVAIDQYGVLTLSGNNPTSAFTVTVTATTSGGQVLTTEVTCQTVSQLIFTNVPANGVVVYEI
jgi:hypothetical protein